MRLARILFGAVVLGAAGLTAACGGSAAAPPPSCPAGGLPEQGSRGEQFTAAPKMVINVNLKYSACLSTSFGLIKIQLNPKSAPVAVNNFVFLATHKFYTNILFHRVLAGFMIQTGDPQGTGSGSPGYSFEVENSGSNYTPGTVAMANSGQQGTNGSQFFICDAGTGCAGLDSSWATQPVGYTIFGHVTSGMSVVHKLATVPVKAQPGPTVPGQQAEKSRPVTPIYMYSVHIYRST